jgi:formylglycine-generating enzyme required for sulfatase activity
LDGPDRYTHYPRAILWLVRGGQAMIDGQSVSVEPFYLSKLPITNIQFAAFDASFKRCEHSNGDDDTAVGIDLDQARGYCEWYARVARKPMRLPSEIEWEYACRADTTTTHFFGDPADADPYVRHAGNSTDTLPALRETRPNPFGLQSMLGGVWEWTSSGALRGGSYRTPLADIAYHAHRTGDPTPSVDDVGFRIARSLR